MVIIDNKAISFYNCLNNAILVNSFRGD